MRDGGTTVVSWSGPRQRRDLITAYCAADQPTSPDLQALVDLAAQVCGVSTARITLRGDEHEHTVAATGVSRSPVTLDEAFRRHVRDAPTAVLVGDASRDPRFQDSPSVNGDSGATRFFASVPLLGPGGEILGRLSVSDTRPRDIDADHTTGLQTVARRVVDVLDLRLQGLELEHSFAELTAVKDELRRSNDHLALFAGQVSHDLRTPLTAIMASTELLSEADGVIGHPDLEPLVLSALDASRRMAALIEEILGQATFGARLTKGDVDLNAVVRMVRDDLAPVLEAAGGTIATTHLPLVLADPHQLYSVLLNLVSNALKFARPGLPPQVLIISETLPDRWRVSVIDNGRGIPPEQQRQVLAMYARADPSVPGTGIGLSTAKRIVEAHGGLLRLESTVGSGTTVIVELPRR